MSDKLFAAFIYAIILLGGYGYLANIVKIMESSGLEMALRLTGIVLAPLGVIMGYF